MPQLLSKTFDKSLSATIRAATDDLPYAYDGSTFSELAVELSLVDAMLIYMLHDNYKTAFSLLYEDRLAEAREHHEQAVTCCDELLESLTNPEARQHVAQTAKSLETLAEELQEARSEEREARSER